MKTNKKLFVFKTLCNSLCTTQAFHNDVVFPCFACGKCSDDQFHFLRCSKVSYLFQLTPAFMHICSPYFSHQNLARLSIFYEVYYLLTRRYGKSSFYNNKFAAFAATNRCSSWPWWQWQRDNRYNESTPKTIIMQHKTRE